MLGEGGRYTEGPRSDGNSRTYEWMFVVGVGRKTSVRIHVSRMSRAGGVRRQEVCCLCRVGASSDRRGTWETVTHLYS